MNRKFILIIGVVAILAVLIGTSAILQELFLSGVGKASTWASSMPALAMGLFVALAVFSALISPFSTIPLVPIAAGLWGVTTTTVLLFSGWLLGDSIAYFIAKYGGNTILRQFFSEKKLHHYQSYISERVTLMRALVIRLALPAEIGYGFGVIRYSFWRYLFITAVAEGVFAVISVQAADALIVFDVGSFLIWITLLLIVIGSFYYLLRVRKI